jgi:hypothetical protein
MLVDVNKELGHRLSLESVAQASLGVGKIADGLDAIGAPEASTLLHYTVREIGAANAPGRGSERALAIRQIAERLVAALAPMRAGVEAQLLDFAFRQPELMPQDAAPPAA